MANNSSEGRTKRALHRTVAVGDSLYVWAGLQDDLPRVHDSEEKRKFTSNIQHFTPSTGQWVTNATTGTPPLGVIAYCCTAIDYQLYYFGGWCGHDYCYHNNITQLDTVSFQWRELEPTDATRPVMRRGWGGMISFEHDRVHHLLMIGGLGSKPAVQLPHYKYNHLPNGNCYTNEHSMYNLLSRKWSNPEIIGQHVPLAGGFVMQQISNARVILYGGLQTEMAFQDNTLYLLEISISEVCWQCIKKPEAINDSWPSWRYFHAGAIFSTGPSLKYFIISGGTDDNGILDEIWILDISCFSWKKVPAPCRRLAHSLSVFSMTSRCIWLVATGGTTSNAIINAGGSLFKYLDTTITELVLDDHGDWIVSDTLDTEDTEAYKSKFQQQLQLLRREWIEEYQKPIINVNRNPQMRQNKTGPEKQQIINAELQKQLEVMEREKEVLQEENRIAMQNLERMQHKLEKTMKENEEDLNSKICEFQKKEEELHNKKKDEIIVQLKKELQEVHQMLYDKFKKGDESQNGFHTGNMQLRAFSSDIVVLPDDTLEPQRFLYLQKVDATTGQEDAHIHSIQPEDKEAKKKKCNDIFGDIDAEVKAQGVCSKGVQFDYLIPLIDKLREVCVAGDKLFLIQSDLYQLLNWEEYGLRIAIPQEAVQPSDTVEVAITALVGGEFILPEDTELVSAVYAIAVSKPLLKPVQLEIQHCVSIEKPAHSNYLSFATAPNDQPPYQFQPVEGGEFPIGNQYGRISLSEFSVWSIIKTKVMNKLKRGHSQTSSIASGHSNGNISSLSTVLPSPVPLLQSPSANEIPSPHAQPSPSYHHPSALPDDAAALPQSPPNISSNLMTDTASVPLSPLSNPSLSSSPTILSPTFPPLSPPSTNNTGVHVPSSPNVSIESSASIHTASSTVDFLQLSITDESPVKNYFGQVMYKKVRPEREWLMRFLLCKDLNALIKFIHSTFKDLKLDLDISFNFNEVDGYIELCFDAMTCRKGWLVIPHQEVPTRVSQKTIDLYGSISPPRFPQCLITITFTPGDDTEPQLTHPVTLTGIKSDTKLINIVLTIGDPHHSATITTTTPHTPSHDEGDAKLIAKRVFKKHYADLSDLLAVPDNMSAIASRLYSENLIPEDTFDNISTIGRTGRDKAESVLRALKATISIQPQSLRTLIEILRRNDALKVIADKMDLEMSFHSYTEQ